MALGTPPGAGGAGQGLLKGVVTRVSPSSWHLATTVNGGRGTPQEDRAGAAESSELVSVSQAGEHSTEEWVPLCDLGQSPASCLSRPGLPHRCQEWPKVEGQEVTFFFFFFCSKSSGWSV